MYKPANCKAPDSRMENRSSRAQFLLLCGVCDTRFVQYGQSGRAPYLTYITYYIGFLRKAPSPVN